MHTRPSPGSPLISGDSRPETRSTHINTVSCDAFLDLTLKEAGYTPHSNWYFAQKKLQQCDDHQEQILRRNLCNGNLLYQ
jgi:hypothetical protein